ncbi:hypothetical protein ACS0TY_000388 [Phlomoides rotata]
MLPDMECGCRSNGQLCCTWKAGVVVTGDAVRHGRLVSLQRIGKDVTLEKLLTCLLQFYLEFCIDRYDIGAAVVEMGGGGGGASGKFKKAAKKIFVQTCGSFCQRQQTHVDSSSATTGQCLSEIYLSPPKNRRRNISCKKISSEIAGQRNSIASPSTNKAWSTGNSVGHGRLVSLQRVTPPDMECWYRCNGRCRWIWKQKMSSCKAM